MTFYRLALRPLTGPMRIHELTTRLQNPQAQYSPGSTPMMKPSARIPAQLDFCRCAARTAGGRPSVRMASRCASIIPRLASIRERIASSLADVPSGGASSPGRKRACLSAAEAVPAAKKNWRRRGWSTHQSRDRPVPHRQPLHQPDNN